MQIPSYLCYLTLISSLPSEKDHLTLLYSRCSLFCVSKGLNKRKLFPSFCLFEISNPFSEKTTLGFCLFFVFRGFLFFVFLVRYYLPNYCWVSTSFPCALLFFFLISGVWLCSVMKCPCQQWHELDSAGGKCWLVIPFFPSNYLFSFQESCCAIHILTSSHYSWSLQHLLRKLGGLPFPQILLKDKNDNHSMSHNDTLLMA